MKRKMYEMLLNWKKSSLESLLIKGPRQVGKTYLIESFGKNEFDHILTINFEDQLDLRNTFEQMPNPNEAVETLQTYGISQGIFNIEKDHTLIFFDEIQLSPRAFSLLKPLTEMNRFKIVASGSLLGLTLSAEHLNPGPTVKHVTMDPLDFEEFMWAVHGEKIQEVIEEVRQHFRKKRALSNAIHQLFSESIQNYILVGGMPKVVQSFIQTRDFGDVFQAQTAIVNLYRNDIQLYQNTKKNQMRTLLAFNAIPTQLAKENKRFVYKEVQANRRSRDFKNAMAWLDQSGDVLMCHQIKHTRGSLIDGKTDLFKLYMNDIGLLVSMFGPEYVYKIQSNMGDIFKGAIYEQLVAQILKSKGYPLYYYKETSLEIDFLVSHQGQIIPIEVKSGHNTKSKSLQSYLIKKDPPWALKVSLNPFQKGNKNVQHVPHYALALVELEDLMPQ